MNNSMRAKMRKQVPHLCLVSETDASEQWGDSLGESDVDRRYGRRSLRQPARQTTVLPGPTSARVLRSWPKDAYRFTRRNL